MGAFLLLLGSLALALSSAGIVAEVRRAWRIIPPGLDVPIGWARIWPRIWNYEATWFWPKSWALIAVGGSGLLMNLVAGVVMWFQAEPRYLLQALFMGVVAAVVFVYTTAKLRMGIAELRRRGKQLRE